MIKAEYVDHMGDDLRVVNAARVSFDKESNWEILRGFNQESLQLKEINALRNDDKKLISYLAKHGHWTPFAHPQITIRETVTIFVARQRFKHMVGFAYNEVSRRYVDDTPVIYHPDVWRCRPDGSVKQGSGGEHPRSHIWAKRWEFLSAEIQDFYAAMIDDDVAPEQARMVLPQAMFTSYYVTGSLAAWARAYKQRIDPHAQLEIQGLARQWGEIIAPLFPVAWAGLTQ